jgi:hypothetical protein
VSEGSAGGQLPSSRYEKYASSAEASGALFLAAACCACSENVAVLRSGGRVRLEPPGASDAAASPFSAAVSGAASWGVSSGASLGGWVWKEGARKAEAASGSASGAAFPALPAPEGAGKRAKEASPSGSGEAAAPLAGDVDRCPAPAAVLLSAVPPGAGAAAEPPPGTNAGGRADRVSGRGRGWVGLVERRPPLGELCCRAPLPSAPAPAPRLALTLDLARL